jgi:hypothetical protein
MYGLMSVLECLSACFFAIASICSRTDFSTSEVSTFALSVEMLPATTCNNKIWQMNRGEAGHSGHETGVGIGQAQDRKGHVLTLSYVLKRKKIV